MPQRLTATETALLAADTRRMPQHVGSVDVFVAEQDGGDIDMESVAALIQQRLDYVPRYRMRIRTVPGGLAPPVWVEDEDFDPSFHIRRTALPHPGDDDQLDEFVARVTARQLDPDRPLWEVYLVEGLRPDPRTGAARFALVTKSHLCLIDGMDAVELSQVLFSDQHDEAEEPFGSVFEPLPEPRPVDLLIDAVREGLTGPRQALTTVGRGLATMATGGPVADWAGATLRGARGPAGTPFGGEPSGQRRFTHTTVPLDTLRQLRTGRYTINDVLLTVLAGGLRGWLAAQEQREQELLALVPMSVVDTDGVPSALGSHVTPHLIALPLAEPNPLMLLHQISYGTRAHTDTGRAVSARRISDIAGFAPTTLQGLGVRAAQAMVLRPHHLLITNAPGPQHPVYLAGARMTASCPVLPVEAGRLVSIGLTSYDGTVFIGISTDRSHMGDPVLLADCIDDAVGELRAAIDDSGQEYDHG